MFLYLQQMKLLIFTSQSSSPAGSLHRPAAFLSLDELISESKNVKGYKRLHKYSQQQDISEQMLTIDTHTLL